VATLYGTAGKVTLFVKEGYLPGSRFFGTFEPFNLVELYYRQSGNLLLPEDLLSVERLSYLASGYERFSFMSRLARFTLSRVSFYDEQFFNLLTNYLKAPPSEGLYLRFILEFLKLSGITPKFLSERKVSAKAVSLKDGSPSEEGFKVSPSVLNYLIKLYRSKRPERLRLPPSALKKAEEFLNAYMDYHQIK